MPTSIRQQLLNQKLSDLKNVAFWLTSKLICPSLILLKGDLGTGKTTLVKKILSQYGYPNRRVKSPTFSLINLYRTKNHLFAHLDLYRLTEHDPFLLEEIQELVDSHDNLIVIIEWPEKIDLPERLAGVQQIIEINLHFSGKNCRNIDLHVKNF